MELVWRGLAALAGALTLELLGVPAGGLIGAALGAGSLAVTRGVTRRVGARPRLLAFGVLGWLVGAQIGTDALAAVPRLAGPLLVVLVGLAVCATVVATALVRWAGWQPASALLAAAPGGLGEMAALGVVSTDEAELVTAQHVVRLVTILIAVPALVPLLT